MEYIELNLPREPDKSFIVFKETGKFFPCPWHYHAQYELVLVLKSTGRRFVGDNVGNFKEGDLVLLGPLLPHWWVNDAKFINGNDDGYAEAIVIHFTEDFLGKQLFAIPEMDVVSNFLKMSNRGIAIEGDAKIRIHTIMKDMHELNGLERLSSLFSIFNILSGVKDYQLLATPGFIKNNSFRCSHRLDKVVDYVLNNFDQDITLPEAASYANMSLTTFCNYFKVNYRLTFVEFVNSVRVGHACKLLFEKDRNVVEVAYQCGYHTLANFNKQFKKYKQMTPTEYRRALVRN